MELYGLIGRPLGHSRSAILFAERFALLGLEARYELYELASIDELPSLIDRHPTLRGLNVTAPYKGAVLRYCSYLSPEVHATGAANVLRIVRDANPTSYHLEAYNTDIYGFGEALRQALASLPRNALILGTGGAARAVAYALGQMGIDSRYVSRSPRGDVLGYTDLEACIPSYELIVNATPVGYHLKDCPPIPYTLLTAEHVCYDLIYNPEQTTFLTRAAAQGARTIGGLSMLRLQADGAWAIWASGSREH